ncbi:MAG: hypothetical protein IT290_12650 [Deltaproteobacteria bacterium]|nr:hypothetical protein [Deltaproteobacteria bacterium]
MPPATPFSAAERERLWRSAITEMAFGQQLFRSSAVGGLLRVVAPFSSSLRELDALFSFGRNGSLRVFANPITYRNPLNGEKTTTTVLERLQFASQRSAAVLARLEPHIDADAVTIEHALQDIVGASLDLGLPGVPTAGLTHFSSDGFPLPGLRKPVHSST